MPLPQPLYVSKNRPGIYQIAYTILLTHQHRHMRHISVQVNNTSRHTRHSRISLFITSFNCNHIGMNLCSSMTVMNGAPNINPPTIPASINPNTNGTKNISNPSGRMNWWGHWSNSFLNIRSSRLTTSPFILIHIPPTHIKVCPYGKGIPYPNLYMSQKSARANSHTI